MKIRGTALGRRMAFWFLLFLLLPLAVISYYSRQSILRQFWQQEAAQRQEAASQAAGFLSTQTTLAPVFPAIFKEEDPHPYFILDATGTILYHSDARWVGKNVHQEYPSDAVTAWLAGGSGTTLNDDFISGYALLQAPLTQQLKGTGPWVLVSTCSTQDLQYLGAEMDQVFLLRVLVWFLVFVVAGVALIWLMIGSPLSQLTEAAERFTQGDLSVKVNPEQMVDEMYALGLAFNRMVDRFQTLVKGLEKNVNELNATQAALKISENRFRTMFDATNDAILVHHSETGQILDVNQATCNLFGKTREELLQSQVGAFSENVSPYTQKEALEWIRKAAAGGAQRFEWRHRDRNGKVFWTEINMKRVKIGEEWSVLVMVHDIDERKKAMEAIQGYLGRLELVHELDQMILHEGYSDAMVDRAVQRISKALQVERVNVVGFNPENNMSTVLGLYSTVPTEIHPGSQVSTSWMEEDYPILQGKMIIQQDLLTIPSLNWAEKQYLSEGLRSHIAIPLVTRGVSIGILSLASVHPDFFVPERISVASEIADALAVVIQQGRLLEQEQKYKAELEKRVSDRTAQLEASNKELEAFTYSVSHDLKAPLRAINGYSQIVLAEYSEHLSAPVQNYLVKIRQNVTRMGHLIEDLLAYTWIERRPQVLTWIQMKKLLDGIIGEVIAGLAEKRIEVEITLPFELIYGDKEAVTLIFENLIDNAIKFSQESSPAWIKIGGEENDAGWRLWVKDNGIGFDMAYHAQIYEVFQRLHREGEYSGTGIGLALVKKAVQRLGGTVWAESQEGVGSSFFVEIPKIIK